MKSPTVLLREFLILGDSLCQSGQLLTSSSLISYTPRQRHIGESAKTAETSNFKNTIGSLKRLVGKTVSDPEIEEYEKKYINAELVDVDGQVGVKVSYYLLTCFSFLSPKLEYHA